METIVFDIEKLRRVENLDINKAINRFSGGKMLFEELTKFVKSAGGYLTEYSADRVVADNGIKQRFLIDAEGIKNSLSSLGMDHSVGVLNGLIDAAKKGNQRTLASELINFYLEMETISANINMTRTFIMESDELTSKHMTKPIIMAVDDNPELLTVLVEMLKADFTVMCVTSGEGALRAVEKHTPHLFLLDIEMPEMDGYDLAAQLRKKLYFKNTPIIFLTAKNTRAHVLTAIERGGNDYILKPFDKYLLLAKINKSLKKTPRERI